MSSIYIEITRFHYMHQIKKLKALYLFTKEKIILLLTRDNWNLYVYCISKLSIRHFLRVLHVWPFQPTWHPPSHCPVVLSHRYGTPQLALQCLTVVTISTIRTCCLEENKWAEQTRLYHKTTSYIPTITKLLPHVENTDAN